MLNVVAIHAEEDRKAAEAKSKKGVARPAAANRGAAIAESYRDAHALRVSIDGSGHSGPDVQLGEGTVRTTTNFAVPVHGAGGGERLLIGGHALFAL